MAMNDMASDDKTPGTDTQAAAPDKVDGPAVGRPNEDAQRGVRMVEAVTLTWSRRALVAVFIKYAAIPILWV